MAMNFEREQGGLPYISADPVPATQLSSALVGLKSHALEQITGASGSISKFERTLERALQDAAQCSKMHQSSAAVSAVDEKLPMTKMKRDWGEKPKDGTQHYEQVCRENAVNGFLKSGLSQNDADAFVLEIFKQ